MSNHSSGSVGMGRERDGRPEYTRLSDLYRPLFAVKCEKCGGPIVEGDWPWCKGNREDHAR